MKIIISAFNILIASLIFTACGGGSNPAAVGGSDIPVTPIQIINTTVSVRWDIPVTKKDGTLLNSSEIGGYKIYVATSATATPVQLINITNRATTEYTLTSLTVGQTYYIYVTTYDVNGDESALSIPVMITV